MIVQKNTNSNTYHTLEDIQFRRNQLSEAIEEESELIADMWSNLFQKNEDISKGEYIATIINNSIKAIDAFLLVRKLMRNYSSVFHLFGSSKQKKNRR